MKNEAGAVFDSGGDEQIPWHDETCFFLSFGRERERLSSFFLFFGRTTMISMSSGSLGEVLSDV